MSTANDNWFEVTEELRSRIIVQKAAIGRDMGELVHCFGLNEDLLNNIIDQSVFKLKESTIFGMKAQYKKAFGKQCEEITDVIKNRYIEPSKVNGFVRAARQRIAEADDSRPIKIGKDKGISISKYVGNDIPYDYIELLHRSCEVLGISMRELGEKMGKSVSFFCNHVYAHAKGKMKAVRVMDYRLFKFILRNGKLPDQKEEKKPVAKKLFEDPPAVEKTDDSYYSKCVALLKKEKVEAVNAGKLRAAMAAVRMIFPELCEEDRASKAEEIMKILEEK